VAKEWGESGDRVGDRVGMGCESNVLRTRRTAQDRLDTASNGSSQKLGLCHHPDALSAVGVERFEPGDSGEQF